MNSSFIGKVEKARRYSEEKDRVGITEFKATFQGDHDTYEVTFDTGNWNCQCHFFFSHQTCSHTMALQRILEEFLPRQQKTSEPVEI